MNNRKLWISILAGVMAVLMVLGLVAGALPNLLVVHAASDSELIAQQQQLQQEQAAIEAQIAELEGQLSDNLDSIEEIVAQKNIIDQEVFMLYEKMSNLNNQIATYGLMIAEKQKELDEAEAHLADLREKNKARIRAMEEDGSLSYWSVLFKANSFSDLLDRLNMVEEIAASDQRRMQELTDAAEVVKQVKAELEEEMAALEQSKKELEDAQVQLEAKRAEADKLLEQLVATGAEYQALLEQAEHEAGRIAGEMEEVEDELYENWLATSVPTPTSPSGGNAPSGSGSWVVPCNYTRLTSPYGWRIHPVYGDWRFHYGVDLAAPSGTPIYATRSGVVTNTYYSSSGGYTVEIDHQDGFSSKYLHQTHYIVSPGQYVTAGQVIGYVGSTGASTGPHLHFSVLYRGEHVNPCDYVYLR